MDQKGRIKKVNGNIAEVAFVKNQDAAATVLDVRAIVLRI